MSNPFSFVLAVGDYGGGSTDPAPVDLHDGVNFSVLGAGNLDLGQLASGRLALHLLVRGVDSTAVWGNIARLLAKLRQAKEGAGPWASVSPVALATNLGGAGPVWFDLVDDGGPLCGGDMLGTLSFSTDSLRPLQGGFVRDAVLTLPVLPSARGPRQTLTAWDVSNPASWVDTFGHDGLDTTVWTDTSVGNGVASVSGGLLRLTPPNNLGGSNYGRVVRALPLDLTGGAVSMRLAENTLSGANTEGAMYLDNTSDGNNAVWWYINGGNLMAFYKLGGTATETYVAPFDSVAHAYLRFRESGGTVYWDTSSDRVSWTNRASVAVASLGFPITGLTLNLYAGTFAAQASPGHLYVDDVYYQAATATYGLHDWYVPGVPGDHAALARLTLTDASGTAQTRFRLGRRALETLRSYEFAGVLETTAVSPGTTQSDGTASGGSCSRLALNSSWRTFATVTRPSLAVRGGGLVDLWARVRSSETLVGAVSGLSGAALPRPRRVQLVSNDITNGVYTQSISWSQATADGSDLVLGVYHTASGVTVTPEGGWGNEVRVSAAGGTLSVWTWCNAPSQSGAVNVTLSTNAQSCRVLLAEYHGASAPLATSSSGSAASGTPIILNEGSGPGLALTLVAVSGNGSTSSSTSGEQIVGNFSVVNSYELDVWEHNAATLASSASFTGTGGNTVAVSIVFPAVTNAGHNGYGGHLPPDTYTIQVVGTNGTARGLPSAPVSVQLLDAGAIDLSWSAATNATSYTVYVSNSLATYSTTTAATSLTLTALPATVASVPTAPAVSQLRALVSVAGSSVVSTGAARTPRYGGGVWELLHLGTFSLPPLPAQDGDVLPAWAIALQGMHPSLTPNLDVDAIAVLPHREPQTVVQWATSTTGLTWVVDGRRDGWQDVTISSGGGTVATASAPDQFTLGAGDNHLLLLSEQGTNFGQSGATSLSLAVSVVPRYELAR